MWMHARAPTHVYCCTGARLHCVVSFDALFRSGLSGMSDYTEPAGFHPVSMHIAHESFHAFDLDDELPLALRLAQTSIGPATQSLAGQDHVQLTKTLTDMTCSLLGDDPIAVMAWTESDHAKREAESCPWGWCEGDPKLHQDMCITSKTNYDVSWMHTRTRGEIWCDGLADVWDRDKDGNAFAVLEESLRSPEGWVCGGCESCDGWDED